MISPALRIEDLGLHGLIVSFAVASTDEGTGSMAPWLWKVNHKGLGKELQGPINTGSSCIVRMSVYNN